MKSAIVLDVIFSSGLLKMRQIVAFVFLACLVFLLAVLLHWRSSSHLLSAQGRKEAIQGKLSVLSPQERKAVQELFDHFFFSSEFAYTAFGSKPMSIGRLLPIPKAKAGWEAWQKIQPSFRSDTLVLRKYMHQGSEFVFIANLKEIETVYRQNRDAFEHAFPEEMTLDALKSCIREDSPGFHKLLENHFLLGILLGYGTHNAELFSRNCQLSSDKKTPMVPFSGKVHPLFYVFSKVMPPSFACDPATEETVHLRERYRKERQEIFARTQTAPLFIQMLEKLWEERA